MKKQHILIAALIIIGLPVAYYLISPLWRVVEVDERSPLEMTSDEPGKEMNESMPTDPVVLARTAFMPADHDVAGEAVLIEVDGKKILRFENFDTVNGPNLHIYLSSSLNEEDYVDLGPIKATKGNVNYELPDDLDVETYNKVLVWCVPFNVLFSYAELN